METVERECNHNRQTRKCGKPNEKSDRSIPSSGASELPFEFGDVELRRYAGDF
jgi:hypothetical protein